MADIIIENLSKKFTLSERTEYDTLRDKISKVVKNVFLSGKKSEKKDFWALQGINFIIDKGDVVGLIGKNGSGKSTLLKIISRITSPTKGRVLVNGRVVSLLEVGTGFHPELTGKENIFLNGAIYGMSKREIESKFYEIVEFSGIERFLDTPIKYYSTGMYVRLAFAIAAHISCDILLIDEVLSVGDYEFQKKCLLKINKITKEERRTIIFVSHNMEAVRNICNKAILLIGGKITETGSPDEVIKSYFSRFLDKKNSLSYDIKNCPGNNFIKVNSLKAVFEGNKQYATIADSINIECEFYSMKDDNCNFNLSMILYNMDHCVLNSISPIIDLKKGKYKFLCRLPGNFLNNGEYSVKIIFSKNYSPIFSLEEMCSFELNDLREINWFGTWLGTVRPKLVWEIDKTN